MLFSASVVDRHGYPDPRPDVTIMAPYYFGLWAPNERSVMNSALPFPRSMKVDDPFFSKPKEKRLREWSWSQPTTMYCMKFGP